MKGATQLVVLLALTSAALAADCHSWREQGQPNLNPIYRKAPVFVNSVANGALYTVGEGDDLVKVVHLWGTPYEKGFAHGSLVQKEAAGLINDAWSYFTDEVIQAINNTGHSLHIPQPIIDWIADVGLEAALDITYELTKPFTGSYFYEEMHGLADGAQIDYKTLRRVHMIGELTRGTCSMFGAWGNATASIGGRLLQLRALDWAVDGPFKNYPQITVYHANNSNEYSYANVGWSGWIGLITGISENQMGVSEIGVAYPDATFGNESRAGIPFTNILKDVLQFDNSWTAAVSRISNANRTCDLILGVGDGKATQFRGIAYSHSTANFYTDTDMEPTADWHPRIPNIVYYGMDWICPAFNRMMAAQLTQYYGNITADNTVAYVTSIVQTGDLHVAIYDLAKLGLYVANARADYEGGPDNAYDRTFVFLDMTEAFAVPQPGSNQLPIAASVM